MRPVTPDHFPFDDYDQSRDHMNNPRYYVRHLVRPLLTIATALFAALVAAGCGGGGAGTAQASDVADRKVRVVATTNFVADLAEQIGGERADVEALMGPGVDPHLYKASAGDVETLSEADVIYYGGLELEGRMTDLFVELASERKTVPVTKDIPEEELTEPDQFDGKYDPHVWFDVDKWKIAATTVADTYKDLDPEHADEYDERLAAYQKELDELGAYVEKRVAEVPERSRVLVTSHDAFGYFGERYGFDVVAIQGVSTATEATTADIKRVAGIIADRDVKAVFVESSVPRQTIDSVLDAARERGHEAKVGGELFADAAGEKGTPEGTYIGMVRHNIDLIADNLA